MPAKTSCDGEYVGPAVDDVNWGSTRASVASVASTATAGVVPSVRNVTTFRRRPPESRHRPMMPVQTIMTVANTVSRASTVAFSPPDSISATISEASITVIATASTSVPNGSPTFSATTSAWWTAANTAAMSSAPASATTYPDSPDSEPMTTASSSAQATNGAAQVNAFVASNRPTGLQCSPQRTAP